MGGCLAIGTVAQPVAWNLLSESLVLNIVFLIVVAMFDICKRGCDI